MTRPPTVNEARHLPYAAAVWLGIEVYIYTGTDRDEVAARIACDTRDQTPLRADGQNRVQWLQPAHLPETYGRLCEALGYRHVHMVPSPTGAGS